MDQWTKDDFSERLTLQLMSSHRLIMTVMPNYTLKLTTPGQPD